MLKAEREAMAKPNLPLTQLYGEEQQKRQFDKAFARIITENQKSRVRETLRRHFSPKRLFNDSP